MAVVEQEQAPLELESGEDQITERPLGAFTRPGGGGGWRSWLFTVDHKKIGIMYGAAGLLFFIIGGIYALFMRLQALTRPVFNWAATLGESIWWLRIALSRP